VPNASPKYAWARYARARLTSGRRSELLRGDQQRRDQAAGDQEDAHDQRGDEQQPTRVPDAALGTLPGIRGVSLDQRHDGHAGLEAGEAQGQLGEQEQGDADHHQRITVRPEQPALPFAQHVRVDRDPVQAVADDDGVQEQVHGHEGDRDADGLLEALEEDRPQQGDQHQRDCDLLAVQEMRGEGVLDDVGGGVGGREGDGDDEVGGHEAEQGEDEELALPPPQQVLEHGDRAFAMRALAGDPAVDRQGPQQRQQDEDQRGDGREGAGGQGGDAGLVAQRGEIVDAGQAHHLPPRVLVVSPFLDRGPLRLLEVTPEQPALEGAGGTVLGLLAWDDGLGHGSDRLSEISEMGFDLASYACVRFAATPIELARPHNVQRIRRDPGCPGCPGKGCQAEVRSAGGSASGSPLAIRASRSSAADRLV